MKTVALTRVVWLLSLVSLLTDMASEMLYPIMPGYLKSIGFSAALIGLLEGIAEAITGLSKSYFGALSDRWGKRAIFVQAGYALSAIAKPLLVVSTLPWWVFLMRTADRLGKGLRTGARDALLASQATPYTKGQVFGFHRAMDTAGAVIGPILAMIYLHYYPQNYKQVFLFAFVPGLLAVIVSLFLKEKSLPVKGNASVSFFAWLYYWKDALPAYRKLTAGLLAFALFNSSDMFLLLKAKEIGLSDSTVVGLYLLYNSVYSLLAYPAGFLADRIGLKTIFLVGIFLFALVYFGMAFFLAVYVLVGLFLLYGLYMAATESIVKAWIAAITPSNQMATAIGTLAGFQSIATLLASTFTGIVWTWLGSKVAFAITGVASSVLFVYFLYLPAPKK
ncbi:MAG: MFS transporter [Cytophagales bacterium]|nr:MFS transporter [Bernardetiaceae bacterium]MDW8211843.1 MFS transporter [Cytophagales bacterium]